LGTDYATSLLSVTTLHISEAVVKSAADFVSFIHSTKTNVTGTKADMEAKGGEGSGAYML